MAIIKAKPTSPGRRFRVQISSDLPREDQKKLVESKNKISGRNNNGRITVRHKGGGHKRLYRIVDFKRNKFDVEAKVLRLEYDPNRSANIALIEYKDGERAYIIAPKNLKIKQKLFLVIRPQLNQEIPCLYQRYLKVQKFTVLKCDLAGGTTCKICRNNCKISSKEGKYATLRLVPEK